VDHAPSASGQPPASADPGAGLQRARDSMQDMLRVFDAAILAMAHLAEPGEAGNHIVRIQHFVRALAQKLKASPAYGRSMSEHRIGLLFRASPLHDIGNAGVPDRILLKPGPLTPEEIEVIRTHPTLGRDTIDQIRTSAGVSTEFLEVARDIAYGHQEHWDGTGYPQGLAGEAIPMAARIMAIADAYDALTSDRVYRAGVAHDKAVQQIFQERAAQFDPDMVDAFIEIQDEFAAIAERFADTESDFQQKIDYMAKAIAESP
jgi:putative two-component system response regulator